MFSAIKSFFVPDVKGFVRDTDRLSNMIRFVESLETRETIPKISMTTMLQFQEFTSDLFMDEKYSTWRIVMFIYVCGKTIQNCDSTEEIEKIFDFAQTYAETTLPRERVREAMDDF